MALGVPDIASLSAISKQGVEKSWLPGIHHELLEPGICHPEHLPICGICFQETQI